MIGRGKTVATVSLGLPAPPRRAACPFDCYFREMTCGISFAMCLLNVSASLVGKSGRTWVRDIETFQYLGRKSLMKTSNMQFGKVCLIRKDCMTQATMFY